MKEIIYKILYRVLKKDMINKLKSKHFGEQFIDTVMESFDMPTNFLNTQTYGKPVEKGDYGINY